MLIIISACKHTYTYIHIRTYVCIPTDPTCMQANEQMLLQRLAASKTKEAKVQSTLKDNVQSQSERTESLLSRRMESTQENREAHLKALRDRLQAKKEHSEKVRQTKMSPLRPPPGPALAAAL